MLIRWKLTRPMRHYRECDVLVLSIAKSGRTWLRVLVNKYISLAYGLPFSIDDLAKQKEGIPSIAYTHEEWSHRTIAAPSEILTGKFLLPDRLMFRKKLLLLHRDPRDTVVSLYFEVMKRDHRTRGKVKMTISEFIRDRKFGIESMVEVMNHWHRRFRGHPSFMGLGYEALHSDPAGSLSRSLEFMGFSSPDGAKIREAVEFATFENMKRMEREDAFGVRKLRPANPNDPDSYKVREGKVGGYMKYFESGDLALADAALKKLDPSFGYF